MKINQVFVAYKQVSSSPHGKHGSRNRRVQEGNNLHVATLNELYGILKEFGIPFEAQNVRHVKNIGRSDLVITVGGDGTVLTASHFVERQPILGIKSFGRQSVGYFCAATRNTMRKYLVSLLAGKRRPIKLHRLQVSVNGHRLTELALNDVLFAHAIAASTSAYKLAIGRESEEQKSSGIWISTAAGSTAAVLGAGGRVLPLTSDRIEYVVREPYSPASTFKLIKGVLSPSARIKIVSYMSHGTVFIDGGTTQYPAPYGSVVKVRSAKKPLSIYWR